MNSALLSNF